MSAAFSPSGGRGEGRVVLPRSPSPLAKGQRRSAARTGSSRVIAGEVGGRGTRRGTPFRVALQRRDDPVFGRVYPRPGTNLARVLLMKMYESGGTLLRDLIIFEDSVNSIDGSLKMNVYLSLISFLKMFKFRIA